MTTGIIMAAGKGSRMQPLTNHTPKPLAKIGNQTLLEINMHRLAPLVDSFVIVVYYLADQIEKYIGDTFEGKPVHYAHASGATTGTLDAFRTGAYLNTATAKANFVVTNSDNVIGLDYYSQLSESMTNNSNEAVLMATKLDDFEILKASGVFVVDENNYLVSVAEKSPTFVSDLVNIGLYYFPNHTLELVSPIRPAVEHEEPITDLFIDYHAKHPIKILSSTDYYCPVTTVEDLTKVQF